MSLFIMEILNMMTKYNVYMALSVMFILLYMFYVSATIIYALYTIFVTPLKHGTCDNYPVTLYLLIFIFENLVMYMWIVTELNESSSISYAVKLFTSSILLIVSTWYLVKSLTSSNHCYTNHLTVISLMITVYEFILILLILGGYYYNNMFAICAKNILEQNTYRSTNRYVVTEDDFENDLEYEYDIKKDVAEQINKKGNEHFKI